jgi:hypothetical protein
MRECALKGRDMYDDLEKIEARGKRKKKEKKGFSLFGKKEGQEEPVPTPAVEPAPMSEPEESSSLGSPAEPTPESNETAVSSEAADHMVYSEPESDEEQQPEESVVITEFSESPERREQTSSAPESAADAGSQDTANSPGVELVESTDDVDQPEKDGRTLQDSHFYKRDIYAAYDEIEQRGKSLKEKRSGFFKQDRPEEVAPSAPPEVEEPPPDEVVEAPVVVEPIAELVEEPVAVIPEKPEPQETIQETETASPKEEKSGPTLQDSQFYKRDIYAEFDTIEQRGKSLKEKRSGFFAQDRPVGVATAAPPEVKEPPPKMEEPPPEESVEAPVVVEPIAEPVAIIPEEPKPPDTIQETETAPATSGEEKSGPTLQDSQFYKRDIYADFDTIEQRGKSLKEKRSGFFTQDRPMGVEPAAPPEAEGPPEKVVEAPVVLESIGETVEEPVAGITVEPEPLVEPAQEELVDVTIAEPQWEPLTGRQLKKAEVELLQYKRKLDKGFRSGKLTKEECISMVRKKETKLRLKPPTESS